MKNLIYKEFKLTCHPTIFIFLSFVLMLLIPSYIYYVPFFYSCLALFFSFLSARENRDVFYTSQLPVRKQDVVYARILFAMIYELVMIILAIPFAVLGSAINPKGGNEAGINANVAFFGFTFLMFGLYNISFFVTYYKNIYKVGRSFVIASIVIGVFIVIAETLVHIPGLRDYLYPVCAVTQIKQIPVLIAGIIIFIALTFIAAKKSWKLFDASDL